jgi:ketosteroid isomerase-like protein
MSSTTVEQVRALGERWARAERDGDAAALDDLSVADFTLVGPLGFVLDKREWLDRFRAGAFTVEALDWEDVSVRDYGEAAVAIGVHAQRAAFGGNRADGKFRATHIAVRDGDRWRLAGMHLSPIGGPPPFAPAPPAGADDRR